MRRIKVLQGTQTEHWLDRYKREHRKINCEGNYIRIPAAAWVQFQKLKNKYSGRQETLVEANAEFERNK